MARRRIGERGLGFAVTAVLFAAAMQPPFAVLALMAGVTAVAVLGAVSAWRVLVKLGRSSAMASRAARPLGYALAVIVGLAAGALVVRMRIERAKTDAERFVPLLVRERQTIGRYPVSLDTIQDAPPLPAFAAPGFYSASEGRDEFTLRLEQRTWLVADTWTEWLVYESRTGAWSWSD